MANDYGAFESHQEMAKFEETLRQMGINPANVGQAKDKALPDLPGSDPYSLQRNTYNGFYKCGAREFWGDSEVALNHVEDFKKCQHYLMKRNNEAYCTKCHSGWIVNDSFQVIDGKLHDGNQFLEFQL